MNHNPSDNSANVPPSAQAVVNLASAQLNPKIQQALGCLDIKLEDELNRFRIQPQYRSADPQSGSPDLATWEQQSIDLEHDSDILTAEIIQSAQSRMTEQDDQDSPNSSGFIVLDGLSTSSKISSSGLVNPNYAPMAVYREDLDQVPQQGNLDYSTGGEIAPFHDQYLSSSQELLRQIQSGYPSSAPVETPIASVPPVAKNKHFTPLKIGSVAVACVLAGGVAYTALNPQILPTLTATKAVVPVATTNTLGGLIQSPNLATNEFTELNLSTLNNIKLPTATAAAPATNVSVATTAPATTPTGVPVAIPFKGTTAQVFAPATITSQPKLADSLIKSLLPSNFQSYAKPPGYRPIPSTAKR